MCTSSRTAFTWALIETDEYASAEPIAVRLIGTVFCTALSTVTGTANIGAVCAVFVVQPPVASRIASRPSQIIGWAWFLFMAMVVFLPLGCLLRGLQLARCDRQCLANPTPHSIMIPRSRNTRHPASQCRSPYPAASGVSV